MAGEREHTAASTLAQRGANVGEAAGRGGKRRGDGAVQVGNAEDVGGAALGAAVEEPVALARVIVSAAAAGGSGRRGGGRGAAATAAVLGRVGGHGHGDAGKEGDDEGLDLHLGM